MNFNLQKEKLKPINLVKLVKLILAFFSLAVIFMNTQTRAQAYRPMSSLPREHAEKNAQVPSQENESEKTSGKKAQGSSGPVKAQAKELIYDREKEVLTLLGEVIIEKPPFIIFADEMTIELKTNLVHARKNVKVIKKQEDQVQEVILAEEAEINLDTEAGYLVSGRMLLPTNPPKAQSQMTLPIPPGQMTITGERMEKLNDHQYLFKQGTFTSCQCEKDQKPDLALQAKEINADTQNTAKMHSVQLLIRGQKIFYLPYYEVPISNERKTGFLTPEFGYTSRGGYYAQFPYYLVMGPSADLTIYPTYIQERGFQAGTEFRYNLGPISTGELEAFAMEDRKEDNQWRWSTSYEEKSVWQSGYLKADLRLVSDNEYVRDFSQELGSRSQRELQSRLIFSQNLPFSNLSGGFKWSDDLAGWDLRPTEEFRPDQDELVIQQLPSISYQLFNQQVIGPLGFDLRSTMVNYWREKEELGRAVQIGFTPRITFSPDLGPGLRAFSFAGYRLNAYRQYYSGAEDENFYLTRPVFGGDFSLALEKIYQQSKSEGNKYRHLLEPALIVVYQGEAENPEDPFLQRITQSQETGLVGLQLTSLLFQKKVEKSETQTRLSSEIEINQFYDWVEEKLLDLEIKGFVESPKQFGVETDFYYNLEEQNLTRAQAIAWLEDQRRDRFWLGYVYSKDRVQSFWYSAQQQSAETWLAGANIIITNNLGINYRINYSALYQMLDSQSLTFNYLAKQKCWALSVKLSENLNPEHPEKEPDYSAAVYFQVLSGTQVQIGPEWSELREEKIIPPRQN